jgi:hypothetical protein
MGMMFAPVRSSPQLWKCRFETTRAKIRSELRISCVVVIRNRHADPFRESQRLRNILDR